MGWIQTNQLKKEQQRRNKFWERITLQKAIQVIRRVLSMALPSHTFGKIHALQPLHVNNDRDTCEWIAMFESQPNPTPKTGRSQDGKTAFFSRGKGNLFWD